LHLGDIFIMDGIRFRVLDRVPTLQGYYYKVRQMDRVCCGSQKIIYMPAKVIDKMLVDGKIRLG